MKSIATLTLNPTIDVAYEVARVFPVEKIRTLTEHYDPGGGGINVARVFARLGGDARCYYLSGGATWPALDGLLDKHGLNRQRIAIAGDTRVATAIFEHDCGKEYRFVPPGPVIAPEEWRACLDRLAEARCDYLVASGSLAPGMPTDFYAQVAALARRRGTPMVLDTSGPALLAALERGGLHLVKPSLAELGQVAGRTLAAEEEIAAAAMAIVDRGGAEMVAVTLSERGALLARKEGVLRLPALPIEARSTVGAGDSFLAGMVFALAEGRDPAAAFRWGIAAGAAALLRPGTSLAEPEDIARFLPLVGEG